MIMVQGGDETLYRDIYSRHELIFQWLGFEEIQLIRACSVREQGDVNSRQDILEAAERAVDWIMSSKPA
jgi:hypothetical protein